jgi:hypothetical protein
MSLNSRCRLRYPRYQIKTKALAGQSRVGDETGADRLGVST